MPAIDVDPSAAGSTPGAPSSEELENPFQIRPRMPDEFIGREPEFARIWSLVHDGESVMIVSDMPNGRTSLLRYLQARFKAAGRKACFIDALKLDPEVTSTELLQRIQDKTQVDPRDSVGQLRQPHPPVVLVDDVHLLLGCKNLIRSTFFGAVQMHAQTGGIGFVGTSQRSLLELGQQLGGPAGPSPVFEATLEVRLDVLNSRDADTLVAQAGAVFTATDRAFVLAASGAQPKLLNLLGSALFTVGRMYRDMPGPARRRQALQMSRPDIATVLYGIWLDLPADERWCLLNISAGMRSGEVVPAADPDEPRVLEPSLEGAKLGALVRFFHRLDRAMLVQTIREQFGPIAAAGLPSATVPDATMFSETAEYLRRCAQVQPILHALTSRADVPQDELLRIMQLWDSYAPASEVSGSALDRLVERGLVQPSLTTPCWQIRPGLLHWWLLDHLRDRRMLEELVNVRSEGRDPVDCRILHRFVEQHRDLFRPGALPLVEQAVQ